MNGFGRSSSKRPLLASLLFLLALAGLLIEMALPGAMTVSAGRPPTNTPIPSPTVNGPTNTPTTAGCTSGADCDSKMTLAEKEGQMAQVHWKALTSNTDITTYALGSLLSGGGEGPASGNTATDWFNMVNNFQGFALQTRLHIPLIYGVDAVHGHNNVYGSTVFPHHSGMGATHDTALITQAEQVTRDEVLGTAIRWVFSPCVCTPQDDRWGRTYEGYGENPSDVAADGAAAIDGFQGANGALGPTNVLATAKHFIGDGHTAFGTGSPYLNEGDAQVTEAVLDAVDLPPYQAAIQHNVGSVMISYSSWNGLKDHANQYLISTVLKGTGPQTTNPVTNLGFKGFVISDWQAIDQISTDYNYDVRTSINAGLDMIMIPTNYTNFLSTLNAEIAAGNIPMSRIDDAVTRIINAKFALGLFSQPYGNSSYTSSVGSSAHRAVARQAVRESLVLLKNDPGGVGSSSTGVLPLSKTASYTLVVAGGSADNIGNQMGGWSISWQGASGNTDVGTTLWGAIQKAGLSSSVKLNFVGTQTKGSYTGDVGIIAVGEQPYAEGKGDTNTLSFAFSNTNSNDSQISDVCSKVKKCIVVNMSGRVTLINTELATSSAFVQAWLPGTEGEGITDVLFGDYSFTGTLPYTWPNAYSCEPINPGNLGDTSSGSCVLFARGYGIKPF